MIACTPVKSPRYGGLAINRMPAITRCSFMLFTMAEHRLAGQRVDLSANFWRWSARSTRPPASVAAWWLTTGHHLWRAAYTLYPYHRIVAFGEQTNEDAGGDGGL